MPNVHFEGDVHWWREWTLYIHQYGFSNAYNDPDINYQPGLLYLLRIYAWLCPTTIVENIVVLKRLVFCFDVGAVFLVAYVLKRYHRSPWWSLLLLLNPGYLYNTLLWGQVDSMYTFFCFLSLVLLLEARPYAAIAAMAFSIMMKPQAVFMGPLLLLIYSGWLKEKPVRVLNALLVFGLSWVIICSPFIINGQFSRLLELTFGVVDRMPSVSMHAYNIWYLIFPGKDLVWEPDNAIYGAYTLRGWGMLMFTAALVFTLVPFKKYFKHSFLIPYDQLKQQWPVFLLGAAAVNLVFFYFNTQMHERYIHAAVLLLGAYAFITGKYMPFVLISVAYFLSLDHLMHHCRFPDFVYQAILPYNPIFISLLFLLTLVLVWRQLFRRYP